MAKTRLDGKLVVLDQNIGIGEDRHGQIIRNIERFVGTYAGFENGMHTLVDYLPVTVDPHGTESDLYPSLRKDWNDYTTPLAHFGLEVINIINQTFINSFTQIAATQKITPIIGSNYERLLEDTCSDISNPREGLIGSIGKILYNTTDEYMASGKNENRIRKAYIFRKEILEGVDTIKPKTIWKKFIKNLGNSLETLRQREGDL
jgi:hypothetical protein